MSGGTRGATCATRLMRGKESGLFPCLRPPVTTTNLIHRICWCILLGGACACLRPCPLFAQELGLAFSHRSVEDGLSQSSVSCILQDRYGYLWIGTEDGLNRYDGTSFTVYRNVPSDSGSVSDNWVMSLCEDSSGTLWVGTYNGGLNRYDRIHDRFTAFRHNNDDSTSIGGRIALTLLYGRDSTMWVGLWARGLDCLDLKTGRFTHYRADTTCRTALGTDNVRCLFKDQAGVLWVGTWEGLYRMNADRKGFSCVIPRLKIYSLLQDSPTTMMVGTWGDGLILLNTATGERKPYRANPHDPNRLRDDRITSLCADPSGGCWLGTWGGGLYHTVPGGFKRYVHIPAVSYSLSDNQILCLYYDARDNFWIGTEDGGLNLLHSNSRRFGVLHQSSGAVPGLREANVRCVAEDRRGGMWVGSVGEGIDRYDPVAARWLHYQHDNADPHSLSSNRVNAFCEDANGDMWVAADGGVLNCFRHSTGRFERHKLSRTDLTTLVCDSANTLWIGTDEEGVASFNPRTNTVRWFKHDRADSASLSGDMIRTLAVDPRGAIWVGTWGMGMSRIDVTTGRCRQYLRRRSDTLSLSDNTVLAIAVDPRGDVWVGTRGGGLDKLDVQQDVFTCFSERNGLPNNVVNGVIPVSDGTIWISTNRGLAQFNPSDGSCRVFDAHDGLQGNEFNPGAAFLGENGMCYFGGLAGLTVFRSGTFESRALPTTVMITGLNVFGQPIRIDTAISLVRNVDLTYEDNSIEFEYSAIDPANAGRCSYLYCLEGVDRKWSHAGARRAVSYAHLAPGEYVFRVRAEGDGNEASLILHIHPPFWLTWWFIVLCTVAVCAGAFAAFRYRLNRLLAEERLRTHIASDLHDDLAANLSSIAMYGTIVRDQLAHTGHDGEQLQLLDRIASLAKDSVGSIRDIIWAIDAKTETAGSVATRLHDLAAELCRARGIHLDGQLSLPESAAHYNLHPNQRKHLWLLLKEAVTNAVKHSDCRTLMLSASTKGRKVVFVVKDDGRGYDPATVRPGKGLTTMQMRGKELDGSVDVVTAPGQGTVVTISIRL